MGYEGFYCTIRQRVACKNQISDLLINFCVPESVCDEDIKKPRSQRPGCHELPSAHLTDLTGFVSRGGSSPPLCAGGGCVRSSPASSAALSSSSSSSSSPTPNNSSRSSQTFPSAKPPERARPFPFFVLFCGNFVAEGAVSGLLCRGNN